MSDLLVEFRLKGGSHYTLNNVEFDGGTIRGNDRGGKPYELDSSLVVAQRLLRDRFGWVGGRKRRRG